MHNFAVDDHDYEVMDSPGHEENSPDSAPIAIPVVQNPAYEHTVL